MRDRVGSYQENWTVKTQKCEEVASRLAPTELPTHARHNHAPPSLRDSDPHRHHRFRDMDWQTFVLCLVSGFFNGTFPVFIKTDAVLAAGVHPIVFQLWKAGIVSIVGIACAVLRYMRGLSIEFTPWAAWAAAAWIPSGVCTIISVTLCGVGSMTLVQAAASSTISFFVFWLAFHASFKLHNIDGHDVMLAPWYLLGCLVGMACLISAHQASLRAGASADRTAPLASADCAREEERAPSPASTTVELSADCARSSTVEEAAQQAAYRASRGGLILRSLLGYTFAAASGFFSSLQSGLVQYGHDETVDGHPPPPPHAPPDERFDALGSWLALFGVSALLWTVVAYWVVALHDAMRGKPWPPSLHWRVMRVPGTAAGLCWSAANVTAVLAVLRGGNAVSITQISCYSTITAGAWSLCWYREIRGQAAVAWVAAAAFATTMTILLGLEKTG